MFLQVIAKLAMVTAKDIASTRRRSTSGTYKTRFACRFVRSLMKMKRSYDYRIGGSKSNDDQESIINRRSERIKIAAYTSMARAVGTRRAWSRAFLHKIRNRNYQARLTHGAVLRKKYCLDSKKKKNKKKKRVIISKEPADDDQPANNRTDTLRKLVPGGDSMDICSLLEETAHYIKCLATQVQVMQSVADYYSK